MLKRTSDILLTHGTVLYHKMKQELSYTIQTSTVPFYQSKGASRLIWKAHFQTDWCYNEEGVRQTLDGKSTTQYDMFSIEGKAG